MATKLILDNEELTHEFFEDTRLLGIMAPVKDYLFAWNLNQMMDIDFRINNDIEIQLKRKGRNYFFTVYDFHETTGSLSHYLYNNKFDGEYLLPEFKHLDFLWLMKGDTVEHNMLADFIATIKSVTGVQLVTELTNEKIKNKEHLIF
jgi:hypothetical protein